MLVECPHAGLAVPADLAGSVGGTERMRMRDADLHVDRLCEDVPTVGATLLSATLSRHVVDLNRNPTDVDPLLHAPSFDRRGAPRGVVWRVSTDGRPVAKRPIPAAEVEARVARFHAPYHARIVAELERLRARFGCVVLLAVHSMPSCARVAGSEEVIRRADVVPGTRGRTTAAPELIDCTDALFRDAGLSVRHDDPYRGGYTTAHYGAPDASVHAIQIELSRALYLDENALTLRDADAARVRSLITRLVANLGELVATFSAQGVSAAR